ncbi:SusC/RagA family TonB-linked outer membrane protein [Chitinophaga ginsengisegetis]|uniref:SusC/RagA family TonB-linked outer membrane protein n=1 Tax=Chitinophaga ginsengisegetis TaxID=393003 RepID=UPI003418923A
MTFNYARLRAPLSTAVKWQFPLLVLLMLMTCMLSYGQQRKSIGFRDVTMSAAFKKIESTYQVKFFYDAATLPIRRITLATKARSIREVLAELEDASSLKFRVSGNMIGVVMPYNQTGVTKAVVPAIRGRVTDRKGQPLPGTTVRDIITGKGTVTDANGMFAVNAEEGHPLLISSIGYRQKTQVISGTENHIAMEEDATSLGGVVVMGYTSKQAAELTGAVQKVSGDQLRSSVSSSNILSMLKAKTTGMYIVEPSADAGARGQVLLRGESSLPSGTSAYFGPLIVIDGVISNSQNLQDVVNPADVESVTILKDAASTAIYGSRAAQGVIVVTTKRAAANSGVHVTLDTRYGVIKQNRAIRMMNTTESIALMDKVMQRRWEETPSLRQQFPTAADFIQQRRIYTDEDKSKNFDWEKAMFDDGNFSDISLGLNSGNDKTMVYAGIDWYKEKGINVGNTFDRRNLRLNLVQNFSKKVSGGLNTSAIIDKTISRNGVPALYMTQPFVTPYNADGTLADSIPVRQSNNFGVPYTTWSQNFLAEKKFNNTAIIDNQHLTGTIWLNYRVLPWLSLKTTNTIDYINTHRNSYLDPRSFSGKYGGYPYLFAPGAVTPNGTLTIADTRFFNFTSTNTLNASKQFGQHSLNFLAGTEWAKRTNETNSTDMYNLLPGERNMGAAKNFGSAISVAYNTPYRPSGAYTERASFSAFSELNYNYLSKYYAAASLRTDAFTNFGRNKRYGTFYAVSAGWLINKEAFLADVKAIDLLKLRVVHGTSGRDVGDGYLNQTLYAATSNYTYDNINNIGSAITQLENPDISWETTVNNTAGIDVSLWKRIELSADFYSKLSKNLLQQVFVGSAQGSFQQYQNVGEVLNKGLELMLNTRNIDARNFSWTTNLNVSFNKNTIQKLYGDSLLDNYNRAYYRYEGEDLNVIKAIRYVGVNPDNGAPLFENYDASGKKQVTEGIGAMSDIRNYQTVGSATPKFFGGFTNTFTYKQFSLSAEMWFQVGNYTAMSLINNFQSPAAPFLGRNNVNWQSSQKVWQQPGDKNANYPDVYSSKMDTWRAFDSRSSLIYGNASHIRMRNIRIGYDLAQRTLTKIRAQRAGLFVSMDNVFVIKHKDYVGADPEGASIGTSTAYGGVGIGNANPRRITAGLNVTF